ncbi:heavy-metal-associated domain-containing protein [Thermomonospora cellulosilytica]|uniref:Uncharacterized protein n=1 Tax=Thermomonospora cellulosilytica TaxID=1411118 RepID=A0A7W3RAG1_9ACTN|nr:heavy-metal-associated domain-containing protein [Thermomonospora cellulosilytica]MBA9005822.1 hypothetical protein [Thermomonospora cellulosilytica]
MALRTAEATAAAGVRAAAGAATLGKATVAGAVGQADTALRSVARRGLDAAATAPREIAEAERSLIDFHERRRRRRVWAEHGRAYIEVRGIGGHDERARKVAGDATRSLRGLRGVRWAEVNAVTGQVLVAFDEDRVDVETLLDAVRAVEGAHGTRDEDFAWDQVVLPGDRTPVIVAATELAADCAALAAAAVGTLLGLPALPHRARLAVALFEVEHGLRRRLKRRIGPIETDLVISVANAAVHGLSEGMLAPVVDGMYHALLLGERWERRRVWGRREGELVGPASVPHEPPLRSPRPRPRPPGPIERWDERLGPVAPAAAAGALALTRDPGRAIDAFLAAVPKAATYGRGAFAAAAGWQLARRGIVPLNAAGLRRLDRVSTIVVDSAALRRLHVLDAEPDPGVDRDQVLRAASHVLHGMPRPDLTGAGPWRQGDHRLERVPGDHRLGVHENGRRLGRVTVGPRPVPLAREILAAAGSTRAGLLVTDGPGVAELLPPAGRILNAGDDLAGHVRRLQEAGDGVLVISAADDAALAAADVGVALAMPGSPVFWSADLVCGRQLTDVWRVLRVASAAHTASRQAVYFSQAGTTLATVLAVTARGRLTAVALTPVHIAGAAAMILGAATGLRAARAAAPQPSATG